MKNTLVAIFLSLALATATADVTVKQTTSGKGLGMSGSAPATTYIKGNKMRSEVQLGDKTHITIYDLDTQKMYIFDSKRRKPMYGIWLISRRNSRRMSMSRV